MTRKDRIKRGFFVLRSGARTVRELAEAGDCANARKFVADARIAAITKAERTTAQQLAKLVASRCARKR